MRRYSIEPKVAAPRADGGALSQLIWGFEAEFRELYAAAGFQFTRIIPLGGRAIIEGVPI
jgi:hypothetical protein